MSDPNRSIESAEILGRSDSAGQTTDEGRGRIFPCESCGADLEFHIGDQQLQCPYCGFVKQIEIAPDAAIQEQDYHAMVERLRLMRESGEELEVPGYSEVRCESCGGNVVFQGTLTSTACPYCGSPIQRDRVHTLTRRIPVDGVLPFLVEHDRAAAMLREWVSSRWFAPNEFLRRGAEGKFNGIYLPYWTFDTLTFNAYSGQRGEDYRVTVGTGKNRRTETRTRWYSASGSFQRFFDDVLVVASKGWEPGLIQALEPWPLGRCLPFTHQVLAGKLARTYDVHLEEGFREARSRIDAALEEDVRMRIGGDRQRVDSIKSRYDAITFKHLLLPVWVLVYRYHDRPFQVFINGATGEVQGERPYSWVKITLLVALVLVAALGFMAAQR
jgi:predicted RNA-binding Zn-ribbon protein involved in translation (DUF1610 family)